MPRYRMCIPAHLFFDVVADTADLAIADAFRRCEEIADSINGGIELPIDTFGSPEAADYPVVYPDVDHSPAEREQFRSRIEIADEYEDEPACAVCGNSQQDLLMPAVVNAQNALVCINDADCGERQAPNAAA